MLQYAEMNDYPCRVQDGDQLWSNQATLLIAITHDMNKTNNLWRKSETSKATVESDQMQRTP